MDLATHHEGLGKSLRTGRQTSIAGAEVVFAIASAQHRSNNSLPCESLVQG